MLVWNVVEYTYLCILAYIRRWPTYIHTSLVLHPHTHIIHATTNRFFCDGLIVMGSNAPCVLCSVFMLTVPMILYHFFIAYWFAFAYEIPAIILLVVNFYFFLMATFTEPVRMYACTRVALGVCVYTFGDMYACRDG